MYWTAHLTQKDRDELLGNLNDNQKTFIQEYLKRGRRTIFANVLAMEKASSVDEENIEEVASQWELLDYIDAGPNWQQNTELYCECGRPLRYQYIVQNKEIGEVRKFGIKHFEDHTGIPPHLVKDIVKGIEKIDFEMDELLLKISSGWTLEDEGIETIPPAVEIPKDIQQHFDYELPLLDRQVSRLKDRIVQYLREEKRKQLEALQLEQEKELEKQREVAAQRRQAVAKSMGWGRKVEIGEKIPLEKRLQLGVLVYLDSLTTTQFRASDVCEDLILNHGASTETYSSGRLRIFPNVCIFLEFLVRQGTVELVEKLGVDDRIYRTIAARTSEESEGSRISSQQSLFD